MHLFMFKILLHSIVTPPQAWFESAHTFKLLCIGECSNGRGQSKVSVSIPGSGLYVSRLIPLALLLVASTAAFNVRTEWIVFYGPRHLMF